MMSRLLEVGIAFSILISLSAQATQGPTRTFPVPQSPAMSGDCRASLPLSFTANEGQWDDSVLFRSDANGATFWFTEGGAYYQFIRPLQGGSKAAEQKDSLNRSRGRYETMMVRAHFVGSNQAVRVTGAKEMAHQCSYFIGSDRTAWRANVANYEAIVYNDVYPGVDLKYYGNNGNLEYDFTVSPGGDPSQIQVRYEGVRSLSVDSAGRLIVTTVWGEVIEQPPQVYQLSNNQQKRIECKYAILDNNTFGFDLGAEYDRSLAVVIDPILSHSTYLGGSSDEYGAQLTVDKNGNAYVTGTTTSTNFPTLNPVQSSYGGGYFDIFITKLNASGTALVYSTFLGGSREDFGWGIAVDTFGNAYVTGESWSSDFPTQDGFQNTYGGGGCDAYLVKLSSSGDALLYSTYLGGNGEDYSSDLKIDDSGNVHLCGSTASTDFPTQRAWQPAYGGGAFDAFVTKFNSLGNALQYSTFIGGNGLDWGRGLDIDLTGNVYVGGYTSSVNFPTRNAWQAAYGGGANDVFVTKLNSSGDTVVYSTYVGGSLDDSGWNLRVDADGRAHVFGKTNSTNYPTTQDAVQTAFAGGGSDACLTVLESSGSALHYSTYVGGSGDDRVWDGMVDMSGSAYLVGETSSGNFPVHNTYQPAYGGGSSDGFICKLTDPGHALLFSSYLGGSGMDFCRCVAEDEGGNLYFTGRTNSTNFPVQSAFQATKNGGIDAFVTKFTAETFWDTDGDGVTDPLDNCPTNANPGQEDNDHDGIGNACCCVGARGNVNNVGIVDLSDLSALVSYLTGGGYVLPCPEESNVNATGIVDLSDLSALVSYLTGGGYVLPTCS